MQLQMVNALLVCAIRSYRKALPLLVHAATLMDSSIRTQWYASTLPNALR
jgi:hypothetical protein